MGNNFNNYSDEQLLQILNSYADKFESKQNTTNNQQPVKVQNTNDNKLLKQMNQFADQFESQHNQGERTVNTTDWENMQIDLSDEPDNSFDDTAKRPEIDKTIDRPSCSVDADNNIKINNLRSTQRNCAYRITPERGQIVDFGKLGFIKKYRTALFESKFGTSYYYKQSWEMILQAIVNEFRSPTMITRFGIRNGIILVMACEVDPRNYTDDKLGITIYDILDFHTLGKKLPRLEEIVLDQEATKKLVIQYGDTTKNVFTIFNENRNLKVLRIQDANGIWKTYYANQIGAMANELNRDLSKVRAKAEVEYAFATKNKNVANKGPGYVTRIKRNASEMRKHSFGAAKEAFMHPRPKLIRTVLYSGIGVALAGIGAVTWVIGGASKLIGKR